MSKRIIKNVIMIALIILLCIAMCFTVNGRREDFANKDEMMKKMKENGAMYEGLERPEGMENGNRNFEDGTNEPPAKPEGEEFAKPEDGSILQIPENGEMPEGRENFKKPNGMVNGKQNFIVIILTTIESLCISVLLIYLILSKFNKLSLKETFENKSKIVSFFVLVILVTAIITMFVMLINRNNKSNFSGGRNGMMPMEEEVERVTKAEDVDAGENVNTEIINLNEHTSNITIDKAGNYTLTGEFSHTLLINADGEVVLNLNNAKINNELTAALANVSTNALTINLLDGTTNMFSDGGSSEYDACVFSSGPLTIKGNGYLEVYGNQEEGEGIATETNDLTIDGGNIKIVSNDDGLNAGGDGGTIKINDGTIYIKANGDGIDSNKNIVINGGKIYTMGSSKGGDAGVDADNGTTINGGELIALGSDMLEKPLNDSKQKAIAQNLNSKIESGSELVLKDSEGNVVTSFTADDSFKTIIVSNSKLKEGKYNLYKGEEIVAELECK